MRIVQTIHTTYIRTDQPMSLALGLSTLVPSQKGND